jgi:CRISPR-associated protein Cas5d
MSIKSHTLSLRCSGDLAIFSRPEMKGERMSYPVPTPSAMRGILEAILWKPEIVWRIERIKVLSPIRWQAFKRNEVNRKASAPALAVIERGGEAPELHADESRAQRNTVALRDVDYIVEAHIELTQKAQDDNVTKYSEMFLRRLRRGEQFHQPYFGCRECVADVSPVTSNDPKPISDSHDIGIMLWDILFAAKGGKPDNTAVFFHAKMVNGVIEVPPNASAARATLLSI